MTPEQILLKCGLHSSKFKKYVVRIEAPLPPDMTKKKLVNWGQGLTSNGQVRKRSLPQS
jgi:hypothetical protein